jgi:hypothetical protein
VTILGSGLEIALVFAVAFFAAGAVDVITSPTSAFG